MSTPDNRENAMEGSMIIQHSDSFATLSRRNSIRCVWAGLLACVLFAPGCSALKPVRGVPAAYLPDQFHGPSRNNQRTIDLSLLVRPPVDQHRVAAGDVLSIYIPGVLGHQAVDINSPGVEPPILSSYYSDDPPTLGYPITVRDDHTIALPQLPPLNVYNLTLHQVEQRLRRAYTEEYNILQPHQAMVLVSLYRPRVHRILVVRQETSNELSQGSGPGTVNIGVSKKGTARTVTLRAYENDVLHALAQAEGVDGLPGLDAENTIYIIRRRQQVSGWVDQPQNQVPESWPSGMPGTPMSAPPMSAPPYAPHPEPTPAWSTSQTESSDSGIQLVSHQSPSDPFGGYRGSSMPVTTGVPQHSTATPPLRTSPARMPTPQPPTVATPSPRGPQNAMMMQTSSRYGTPVNRASVSAMPVSQEPSQPPRPSPTAKARPTSMTSTVPVSMPNSQPFHPSAAPSQTYGYPTSGPGMMAPPAQSDPTMAPPEGEIAWGPMLNGFDPTIDNPNVVKIPVRLSPGEQPHFTSADITLYDGDIVFIESRETEVFYTGGLLGGGQYTLPRDYDLRVLEAVSIAEGRNTSGGQAARSIGGISALNQDVSISASRLAILRTLPNGQRITVEVDLKKAMRYKEENILVQPGDMLILEYTFPEAVAAFTQRFLLEGALIGIATSTFTGGGGGGG